jgi:hypothetical protein
MERNNNRERYETNQMAICCFLPFEAAQRAARGIPVVFMEKGVMVRVERIARGGEGREYIDNRYMVTKMVVRAAE